MWDNWNFGTTTYDPYDWLLSIARKSESWNATFHYSELTNLEQTAVAALIWERQEWEFKQWDIPFWNLNEATLRIISWNKKCIENAYVTVITPTDQFWKPYLQ